MRYTLLLFLFALACSKPGPPIMERLQGTWVAGKGTFRFEMKFDGDVVRSWHGKGRIPEPEVRFEIKSVKGKDFTIVMHHPKEGTMNAPATLDGDTLILGEKPYRRVR